MKKRLQNLINKHGIIFVSLIFGFSDTGAIKKWLARDIPKNHQLRLKEVLKLSNEGFKNLVIAETKRRI